MNLAAPPSYPKKNPLEGSLYEEPLLRIIPSLDTVSVLPTVILLDKVVLLDKVSAERVPSTITLPSNACTTKSEKEFAGIVPVFIAEPV